ncbi:MAG: hypothetical protein AAB484_03360 [Patescibacteria group bacterium]
MIFTFLKGEYRQKILGEYRKRLLVLILSLLVLLLFVLLGLALPSFISLGDQNKVVLLEREAYSKNVAENGQTEIENQLKGMKEMIVVLKQNIENTPLVSIIEKILSEKSFDVTISNLSLERKKEEWSINLSGMAETREAMVDFSKRLEAVSSFSLVDLPVSSLAKNKNISFTISLRSKF